MKSTILAALLGAAVVLTGCAADTEPAPRETVYVEQPQSQSQPEPDQGDVEQEFLSDVADHMTPALHNEPQADVVELGYTICDALDRGANIEEIISAGMSGGLTRTDTVVIAAAAVVNFCPEHRNDGSISNMT